MHFALHLEEGYFRYLLFLRGMHLVIFHTLFFTSFTISKIYPAKVVYNMPQSKPFLNRYTSKLVISHLSETLVETFTKILLRCPAIKTFWAINRGKTVFGTLHCVLPTVRGPTSTWLVILFDIPRLDFRRFLVFFINSRLFYAIFKLPLLVF